MGRPCSQFKWETGVPTSKKYGSGDMTLRMIKLNIRRYISDWILKTQGDLANRAKVFELTSHRPTIVINAARRCKAIKEQRMFFSEVSATSSTLLCLSVDLTNTVKKSVLSSMLRPGTEYSRSKPIDESRRVTVIGICSTFYQKWTHSVQVAENPLAFSLPRGRHLRLGPNQNRSTKREAVRTIGLLFTDA